LIDFCLLSRFDSKNPLYKAKSFLDNYLIVLEFAKDSNLYTIKRTSKMPTKIILGVNGDFRDYSLEEARESLADVLFRDPSYPGTFRESWYRRLISYFLRDEKTGFKSPTQYISEMSRLEITIYNLFLLGLDNTLAVKNFDVTKRLEELNKFIGELTKRLSGSYEIKDIAEVESAIAKLEREAKSLEEGLREFRLDDVYSVTQTDADALTMRIKEIILNIDRDMAKIEAYSKSLATHDDISPRKIGEIYRELREDLGIQVEHTLQEAIEFRRRLAASRRQFLSNEIETLRKKVADQRRQVEELDEKRQRIYAFLEARDAITDLTQAFQFINAKKDEANNLKSQLRLYNDAQQESLRMRQEAAALNVAINEYISSIRPYVEGIQALFDYVYNSIYNRPSDSVFAISYNDKVESKFDIKVKTHDSDGWGKGRGCILVYDLAVLVSSLKQRRNLPSFIVHDGVFYGVHRAHFVSAMNLLHKLSSQYDMQYIFTVNEDDAWVPDERSSDVGKLDFDFDKCKVAIYTERTEGKIFHRNY